MPITPAPEQTSSLFFLHIPKTAGVSLTQYLADQYPSDHVFPKRDWNTLTHSDLEALSKFRLIVGHFDARIISFIPKNHKRAIFLRNPIARTISAIRHALRDQYFRPNGLTFNTSSVQAIIHDPTAMAWFANSQVTLLAAQSPQEDILAQYASRLDGTTPLPFLQDVSDNLDTA